MLPEKATVPSEKKTWKMSRYFSGDQGNYMLGSLTWKVMEQRMLENISKHKGKKVICSSQLRFRKGI